VVAQKLAIELPAGPLIVPTWRVAFGNIGVVYRGCSLNDRDSPRLNSSSRFPVPVGPGADASDGPEGLLLLARLFVEEFGEDTDRCCCGLSMLSLGFFF